MLDHVSIPVRDPARAAAFYDGVLAAIGLRRVKEAGGAVGYGREPGWPVFWLEPDTGPDRGRSARAGLGLHISFRANARSEVHAFHAAALAGYNLHAVAAWVTGADAHVPEQILTYYGARQWALTWQPTFTPNSGTTEHL